MDNRKKAFMDNRRLKKQKIVPKRKTEYEKQKTREEVEEIKKKLINYAKTSWGREWIISNLNIGRPFRMQRGIEYANDEKRIENISISSGQIFATVQGTAPTPYRVKIKFELIPERDWQNIIKTLSTNLQHVINLLEGSLPLEIIDIFENNGYSLFPDAAKGLNSTCSCPDKAIPCKHIAAVILYLTRVLDYNPFLLLEIRGKTKEEILEDLTFTHSKKRKIETERSSNINNIDFKFNIPKISIQEILEQKSESEEKNIEFSLKKPGKIIETLENLGNPQTIENKAFLIVLKSIYQIITSKSYELSLEFK